MAYSPTDLGTTDEALIDLTARSPLVSAPVSVTVTPAGARSPLTALLGVALVAALWLWFGFGVVAGIALVGLMITVHEAGHWFAARRANMRVTEFFFGFGPIIWSTKRGETRYGVRLIPLGGFVKVSGMHRNDNRHDPAVEHRTFRAASTRARVTMLAAGAGVQLVTALLAFSASTMISGTTDAHHWHISVVGKGTAAETAGLRPGDTVTAIGPITVNTYDNLIGWVKAHPERDVTLTVRASSGAIRTTEAHLSSKCDGQVGFLGIGEIESTLHPSVLGVIQSSATQVGQGAIDTLGAVGAAFSPAGATQLFTKASHAIAGTKQRAPTENSSSCGATPAAIENRPVSIIGVAALFDRAIHMGLGTVLWLWAFVNIAMAVFNLLPFPPLDGGHILVALYEHVRTKLSGQRYYSNPRLLSYGAVVLVSILLSVEVLAAILDVLKPL